MPHIIEKTIGCILCLQLVAFVDLHAEYSRQESSFDIGPSLSQISYKEPGHMENNGVMYGLSASYCWRGENLGPIGMIKAEVEALWGSVDYFSFNSGSINSIPDAMIETRAMLGTNLFREGRRVITPYAGLGYRRLTDNSDGMISTVGALGYDRQANYSYAPIGIEISSALDGGWSIGGTLEYDFFFSGTQITSIPKDMLVNGSTVSSNFTNDQNKGYGLRASANIKKKISTACNLVFAPYLRYWNINVSKSSSIVDTDVLNNTKTITVVEPANLSTEYGVKVAVEF